MCALDMLLKGNLLTYFRIDSGPRRSDTASVRRRNVPLKFSHYCRISTGSQSRRE